MYIDRSVFLVTSVCYAIVALRMLDAADPIPPIVSSALFYFQLLLMYPGDCSFNHFWFYIKDLQPFWTEGQNV